MLFSMFLYVWIAEKLIPHQPQSLDHTFLAGIGATAVAMVGVALFIRAKTIRIAVQALQIDPGDVGSLNRLRSGSIVSFVLCEAVVLFGFALRFTGATPVQAAPFYIVGVALMLLWWPQRP
jgi:hypothetical protein